MQIRKANMRDIPALAALINSYASQEIMLPRTELELAEGIRDFVVAEEDLALLGCGALHFYTRVSGEVRSLAVHPNTKGRGVGTLLVQELEAEARANELSALFAFTYVPEFFKKLGFQTVSRDLLPLKAWKDCLRCPKFQNCDEIAVLKALKPAAERELERVNRAQADLPVLLPILKQIN
jgi:amino-acid N-acetyltransferase